VSISYIALLVIGLAMRRAGYRPMKFYTFITLGFAALTLGPFLQIAGLQTFIPTPWTLLRYVPLVGDARMPSRFDVVVMMGLAAIFAGALAALTMKFPERRRLILCATGVLLALELVPVPRTLFAADVPAVYTAIAADPRPVAVLDLPFGIRDGLSTVGNFDPASQYYQTFHHKAIIGGYLSRVSQADRDQYMAIPMIKALTALSENRPLAPADAQAARDSAADFIARSHLGYVVIDDRATSPALRAFAVDALGLVHVSASPGAGGGPGYELFVPARRGRRGL
jgi:hypothetical protein